MIRTLKISIRNVANATIVDLDGSITLENSATLRKTLFENVTAAPGLALNLTGIRYIDSSGIATLIEAFKKSRDTNKEFLLFGLGAPVHDVLKLTNLLGVFRTFNTEAEALNAIKTGS